jgi:hypothetical protein
MNKRKGSDTLEPKGMRLYLVFIQGADKMDKEPPGYGQTLKRTEMVTKRNVVNPMYAPPGKQRAEESIKSERRPVMGRTALQDLGHSERRLTYTWSQLAKRGELDERGRSEYRKDCKLE